MNELEIVRPDDWHLHLRDGDILADLVPPVANVFARAIVMPNLNPPVVSVEDATAYQHRIRSHVPAGNSFKPLMTLYLTNNTAADEIVKAVDSECVFACKLYPAGATTHSDAGVTDIRAIDDVLGAMQEKGLPLLVHGESTDPDIDVFDREQFFIKDTLIPTVKRFPDLKVVFEHVTTAHAVEFVTGAGSNIAATITAHHLLLNRNAMFQGGIRPHHYCLPVLKRETHRKALMKAATGASGKFFLGTDSAPHSQGKKESACGCAGMYTAPLAMPLYAEAFESADALDKLEGFASLFGPDFYGLEQNKDKISLVRESLSIDESLPLGDEKIVPFRAGGTINWQVK